MEGLSLKAGATPGNCQIFQLNLEWHSINIRPFFHCSYTSARSFVQVTMSNIIVDFFVDYFTNLSVSTIQRVKWEDD
jgi:hypothetical protein